MASKFEGTNPIKREVEIEGYACNVVLDIDGAHITKKGDKHRGEKPTIHVSWSEILEIGADKMKERGELQFRGTEYNGAYDFLHLEE